MAQAGEPSEESLSLLSLISNTYPHYSRVIKFRLFTSLTCIALPLCEGERSILILERELEAAEFFVRQAIAAAKKKKISYTAAEHDLTLITYYKTQAWE